MSTYPFPPGLRFGTEILFTAQAMRLSGELVDGAQPDPPFIFRQKLRSRGYQGDQGGGVFTGDAWPGEPVPLAWSSSRAVNFPLEPRPKAGAVPLRVRRMLTEPVRGVVIGVTDRSEGTTIGKVLHPPTRRIRVLEVAVAVLSGGARVILVHPQDAQPVPRPRTTP